MIVVVGLILVLVLLVCRLLLVVTRNQVEEAKLSVRQHQQLMDELRRITSTPPGRRHP